MNMNNPLNLSPTSEQPASDLQAVYANITNFEGRFNLEKSGFDPNLPGSNLQ